MKVSQIAELLKGALTGDPSHEIIGVAALGTAGPAELAYVEGSRAAESAAASKAGVLLVPEGFSLPGRITIAVAHPKLALVRAAEVLHPEPSARRRSASECGHCQRRKARRFMLGRAECGYRKRRPRRSRHEIGCRSVPRPGRARGQ